MDIDDAVMEKAKAFALTKHQPLRAVVEEALREKFARYDAPENAKKIELIVSEKTGGLRTGIDLDDSASLYDKMEPLDGPL